MRDAQASILIAAFCLVLSSVPAHLLAQGDAVDDEEGVYTDVGEDVDEIIETDDALTEEAKSARAKKETEALLDGIKWLGQSGFLIEDESTIYIDPYDLPDGLPKADLIFVTHEHYDHLSPKDILKILRPSTKVVIAKAARSGLPEEVRRVITVTPGESIEVDDVKVEVVPAYNRTKNFHPKKRGDVGYVLHLEDRVIYHAGDTDFINEMKQIETDIAFLPAGGTYTMDAAEAARAANAIGPKVAVPIHWGKIVGSIEDAEKFVAECKVPAVIMEVYAPPEQETGRR